MILLLEINGKATMEATKLTNLKMYFILRILKRIS